MIKKISKYRIQEHTLGKNKYIYIEKRGFFTWDRVYKFTPLIAEDYSKCNLYFDTPEDAEQYIRENLMPNELRTIKEIEG